MITAPGGHSARPISRYRKSDSRAPGIKCPIIVLSGWQRYSDCLVTDSENHPAGPRAGRT